MTRPVIGISFGRIVAAVVLPLTLVHGQTHGSNVPASIRPVFDRGLTFHKSGDTASAIRAFDEVIRLQPTFARAYTLRGSAYMLKGDYYKALADLNQAIRLDPKNAAAYCDRADLEQHFLGRPQNALADYDRAITLAPKFQRAYFNRGISFLERHDYKRAVADLTRSIQIMPKDLSAYAPRAYAYAKQGERARAVADAKVAVTLKPSQLALARVTDLGLRGRAYQILSEPELALRDFREAVRLSPNQETSYGNLGWFLSTCPNDRFRNGTEAVSAGKNACELSHWQNSGFIDILAAAYAEAGDFDQAVKYEKQSLTDSSLAPKERQEREKRLALFQQRKPFRDEF
ncbi:MAG: tetratricopeptide repeat protein [Nitrospirota bacterium]